MILKFYVKGKICFVAVICCQRRFYSCSVAVKLQLFKSFCLCFMMSWTDVTVGSYDKLRSAYVKCIKIFFGYGKFHLTSSFVRLLRDS